MYTTHNLDPVHEIRYLNARTVCVFVCNALRIGVFWVMSSSASSGNILKLEGRDPMSTERLMLIDFEYSSYNYR